MADVEVYLLNPIADVFGHSASLIRPNNEMYCDFLLDRTIFIGLSDNYQELCNRLTETNGQSFFCLLNVTVNDISVRCEAHRGGLLRATGLFRIRAARRGGVEVAGWPVDQEIRVRFPAYPHRVWAL